MIDAFFARFGEGEVCWNVGSWKLQKCCKEVREGDGDKKPNCTYLEEISEKLISPVL